MRKVLFFLVGLIVLLLLSCAYIGIRNTEYDAIHVREVERNYEEINGLTFTHYVDCEDLLTQAMQLDSSYTGEIAKRMSKQVYNYGLVQTKSYYKPGISPADRYRFVYQEINPNNHHEVFVYALRYLGNSNRVMWIVRFTVDIQDGTHWYITYVDEVPRLQVNGKVFYPQDFF